MPKKMGAVDTNTLLIVGAAAVGVYLLTRPATPIYNQYQQNPYLGSSGLTAAQQIALQQQGQYGNSTSSIISAGGSALSSILNAIANF